MGLNSLFGRTVAFISAVVISAGWFGQQPAHASCAGMAQAPGPQGHPLFMRASYRNTAADAATAVPKHHLRITYIGHSTFEIETPKGARIQTDYNDYVQGGTPPHIVTMNNSHDSHFSYSPQKGIEHVLRGWDEKGGVAKHNLMFRDIRVRNVPTNLIERGDGKLANGNSMFVFEAVGLCAVHISHLHHYLSKEQLRSLGLIDIAFAPIDGMWTMSHDELFRVLGDIKARMIIPMHFGSMSGVEAFVARAQAKWTVRRHDSNTKLVNLRNMPKTPEVVFLQGY
jgi:L-ascorbate metabolism protein UlaG (beta-lactamase superfamily)